LRIFLSHAHEDKAKVEEVYERLRTDGFSPWMAERDITAGEEWQASIWRAIKASDFFVVFLSIRACLKRGFFQKEIKQALDIWDEKLEDDIYLIPVRLDECSVPERINRFQYVNIYGPGGYDQLADALHKGVQRLQTVPAQSVQRTGVSVVPAEIREANVEGLLYDIRIEYPQISPADTDDLVRINGTLSAFARAEADEFKAQSVASAASTGSRQFRIDHHIYDSFDIRFDVPLLTDGFLSVRFNMGWYQAGAAHPNSRTAVLNILFRPTTVLELTDVFLAGSDYLRRMADYCVFDLHRQKANGSIDPDYKTDDWIVAGAGPRYNNYRAWALTRTGLLVVFDPYRSGSYAEGRREVLIPASVFRDIIKPEMLAILPWDAPTP
jgi:TIR domain/Protein of unknown function (DUF3298)